MFGQPGNNGELWLREFDGTVGNGFNNDSGNSGNATAGNNASNAFDLNEFPSLGGSSAGGDDNNSLAAALRQQQQQLMAQQQMLQNQGQGNNNKVAQSSGLYRLAMGNTAPASANFKMATEDFPALPGAPPLGSGGANAGSSLLGGVEGSQRELSSSTPGSSFSTSAPSGVRTSSGGSNGIFGGNELDGLTNQLESSSLLGNVGLGNLVGNQNNNNSSVSQPQRQQTSQSNSGPVAAPSGGGVVTGGPNGGSALSGDFGLLGLLTVIRMTDADRNALALGSDLTSLGLNLNSSDQLYSTFASPWSENPTSKEPQYQVCVDLLSTIVTSTFYKTKITCRLYSYPCAITCNPQH